MYSWNTTIDDTSPIILYNPYSEGPAQDGWASWFSDSETNWNSFTGEEADGTSLHITQLDGASFHLQFQGTAIYLYGKSTCPYDIELDSQPVEVSMSLPYGTLYMSENLDPTTHSIALTAHPNNTSNPPEQLVFDQATFANVASQDISGLSEVKIQNGNTSTLIYKGNWTTGSGVANIPSKANPGPFKQTQDPLASVSMNFTGGTAVAIHGSRNYGHWTYNVTLDGQTSSYNASTTWEIGDAVLFYQNGLDPSRTYNIEMVNTGLQDYYKLTLNYLSVFMPNDSHTGSVNTTTTSPTVSSPTSAAHSSSHNRNVGVTVGPIVAGVAVLLVALLAVFLRRRTLRLHAASHLEPPMCEDTVVPYPLSMRPKIWHNNSEAGTVSAVITALEPVRPTRRRHGAAAEAQSTGQRSAPVPVSVPVPPPPAQEVSGPAAPARPVPSSRTAPIVVVDQIIEILAQRLNPRPRPGVGLDHDDIAPPRYSSIPSMNGKK